MALHLVLHRADPTADHETAEDIRAVFADAVWEVAESHWSPAEDVLLVASDLSSNYLLVHFRRALKRRGAPEPTFLFVAPLAERPAMLGVPAEAEGWIAAAL